MALENANYSFLQFFFSRLWRTLARKLMKRPAVFTTYFQTTIQIVHVYHVLQSEIVFQKFVGRFHFNVHFFHFPPLLQENLWKDLPILWLIFRILIFMCTLTKFCGLKFFFQKYGSPFKMLAILFISATLSNICDKTYERTYDFLNVFLKFLSICTLSRSFIMTTFLQQKWRPFQSC